MPRGCMLKSESYAIGIQNNLLLSLLAVTNTSPWDLVIFPSIEPEYDLYLA